MKKLLLASLLFSISFLSFGQCPTTFITLSSQADVDAFATNYPDCTVLQNSLTISGADITDLTPLSGITYTPHLKILSNPLLAQFNGLDNLQSAIPNSTSLEIIDNPLLTNLSVFSGLTFLNGLKIIDCSSLSNLDGLNFVTDFEETEFLGLNITNNQVLNNVSALSNISSFDNGNGLFSMNISNNPSLSSLNGLQVFNQGYEYLSIINNDALIDLTGISDNITVAEVFRVMDNDLLQSFNGIVGFSVHEVEISNNPVLSDLSALNGNSYPPFLTITNNPNLAICNNTPFCASIDELQYFIEQYPLFTVENNADGCNSVGQIAYYCGAIPLNDECNQALPLIIGETLETFNELATASTEVPACSDIDRADVWFTFNSGSNTIVNVMVDAGYNIQLWEGSCGALTQVPSSCVTGSLLDFVVNTNTDYYVQVWSCAGCRTPLSTGLFNIVVQDGTLSTQELQKGSATLFPNPVNNQLTVSSTSAVSQIEVYNLLGQSIMKSKPKAFESSLDFSQLKTGIYLVKVASGGFEQTFKVVKD